MVLVVDRFSRSAVVFIGVGLSLHVLPPVLYVQAPCGDGVEATALQVEHSRLAKRSLRGTDICYMGCLFGAV